MPEETMKADAMAGYEFGETAAPEGFDPDAKGFVNPPPGQYVMEIVTFEIKENNTFSGKDYADWIGNQYRPHLKVAEGEHVSKTIMDFLPVPTPGGGQMPRFLANRWAGHITAFGFRPPPNAVVPPGFKLHDLIGSKGLVTVEEDTYDGERQGKERAAGRVPVRIPLFGYLPIDKAAGAPASKPASTKAGGTTAPTTDIDDLDDL